MTNIQIIELWPSVPALVADLGLDEPKMKVVHRIHGWKKRDYIPGEYWKILLKAAEKRKYHLTVQNFLDSAASRRR